VRFHRNFHEVHKQVLTFGWSLRKGENQVQVDPEFINTYNQFREDLSELHKIAITIRKYAKFNTMTPFGDPAENDHFPEGAILSHVHRNIETKFNQSCNEKLLECEICGIHPSIIYHDVCGKSILNQHHLISPSDLDPDLKIKATDFITVCPNCHQTLHILRPWRSRDECSNILII